MTEQQRTSFGAIAGSYDAYRPDWPADVGRWLVGRAAPGRVLDLGAGTGKLTRTLLAAGHHVVALDPSEGMLQVLRARSPKVEVLVADAERIPLPDARVDAVVVAQAWHWFRHDQAAAESARVLRPGGTLGVGWQRRDSRVPWIAELDRIVGGPLFDDNPGFELPAPFGPVEAARFERETWLPATDLVGLASSFSYVQTSRDVERVLADVRELAERVAGPDGTMPLRYVTRCFRAVRQ